jgi:methylenetetrahydrofolate reductase (NADPH)
MSFPASAIDLSSPEMRLAELIAAGSLEISPRELHRAREVAAFLPAGTCVYVPSLPGLPSARLLETVGALKAAGLDPVPHIAARRIASREALADLLERAVGEHGVHRVLLVAGDTTRPEGPYADSVALLEDGLLARAGIKEVGIGGYPEGHPRISPALLAKAFDRKRILAAEQGLGLYVVTQFSFAPARVVEYCAGLARTAPEVAIYVGVAGPTDAAALVRYAQRCGVSVSLSALRKLGSGIARLVTNSDPKEHLTALVRYCRGRSSCNVVGVHLYSFGGALRTARWMREMISA